MTGVAIVDDHRLVRAGLRTLLESTVDLAVVGEAGNGAEAVDLVRSMEPDVVLMDLSMPEVDGIEATRRIMGLGLPVAVIVVLGVGGLAGGAVYQNAARDREYRTLLHRGDVTFAAGQTFGAIEAYSGALALRPDSMLAHLRRGETYGQRGDLESAARDFRTAASLDPSAPRPLEALGDVFFGDDRSEHLPDRTARQDGEHIVALGAGDDGHRNPFG